MTTRDELVAEARRWLGTPFLHQGRVMGQGVDCAGVVVMIARRFGLDQDYVDPPGYPREPHRGFLESILDRYTERIRPADRQPGDIITFAWSGDIHHLAILTQKDRILHALNRGPGSVVVEHGLRGYFLKAMRRVYKFRGID